jgi:hypothetical protein
MSSTNIYRELMALLPASPLLVGTVNSVATATAVVQYPGGGTQLVRATGYAAGAKVFVRDGVVQGPAPALATLTIEV